MGLTPKNPKMEILKSETDLDRYLQHAFSNIPADKVDNFIVTIDSREYNLSDEEIIELGKSAGYTVVRNGYDKLTLNFS